VNGLIDFGKGDLLHVRANMYNRHIRTNETNFDDLSAGVELRLNFNMWDKGWVSRRGTMMNKLSHVEPTTHSPGGVCGYKILLYTLETETTLRSFCWPGQGHVFSPVKRSPNWLGMRYHASTK
jgi:hypothetical protein